MRRRAGNIVGWGLLCSSPIISLPQYPSLTHSAYWSWPAGGEIKTDAHKEQARGWRGKGGAVYPRRCRRHHCCRLLWQHLPLVIGPHAHNTRPCFFLALGGRFPSPTPALPLSLSLESAHSQPGCVLVCTYRLSIFTSISPRNLFINR